MKPHLLRVLRPVEDFERLIAAIRQRGERAGWLEWPPDEPAESVPGPLPVSLAAAASCGVLRAVAIGGGRSVAVKPMAGEPVLRDVLREHFRGCRLILLTGAVDAPLLEPRGKQWDIVAAGVKQRWTTERLIAALAKTHPWSS